MVDAAARLKRIPVGQLRLGMFVQSLDGPWLSHPFWKTRFVLRDPNDLRRLRESAVTEVWIDAARGLDVGSSGGLQGEREPPPAVAPTPPATRAPAVPRPAPATPPAASAVRATPATAMAEELRQAAQTWQQGRRAVRDLFGEVRLGQAADVTRCLPLVDDIAQSVWRNPGALVSLSRLKTADEYSYMHSVAVCALMVALGRQLGMDEAACREAGLAGLLHDLGKALVPVEILQKPDKLSDAEFDIIRKHPRLGHDLLIEAQGAPASAMDVCLHHHERMDGTGYPDRLPGEQLSQLVRMGAVCDVYDAITSNRPYKAGWDPSESIARMASWKGHFDPATLHAFVRSLGIYPNGALVRLASGRLAVVVAQNPESLTAPMVKVFFDTRTEMPTGPHMMDLSRPGSDPIVDREPPGRWSFKHLDALWAGSEVLAAMR